MDKMTVHQLRVWAEEYHNEKFIANDPVQFPHRFTKKKDIEVSGLLTAVMSFGNRKQIIKKVDILHEIMGLSPYEYVMSEQWKVDFCSDDKSSFYRMLSYSDMYQYFKMLNVTYSQYDDIEEAMAMGSGTPMDRLCKIVGVGCSSPQKKLNMFLRWMIRKDSPVDFGIWTSLSAAELIIPLDTHVCRVAYKLGLTKKETFSLSNAKVITKALNEVFPGDPCLGDYALFGAGVNGVI